MVLAWVSAYAVRCTWCAKRELWIRIYGTCSTVSYVEHSYSVSIRWWSAKYRAQYVTYLWIQYLRDVSSVRTNYMVLCDESGMQQQSQLQHHKQWWYFKYIYM